MREAMYHTQDDDEHLAPIRQRTLTLGVKRIVHRGGYWNRIEKGGPHEGHDYESQPRDFGISLKREH